MTVKSNPTTATNEPSKFLDVTPKMTSGEARLVCESIRSYMNDFDVELKKD